MIYADLVKSLIDMKEGNSVQFLNSDECNIAIHYYSTV